jgi:hypothetical protein
MTTPAVQVSLEKQTAIIQDAMTAHDAGLPPDSPQARDIADRYLAALAETTGRHDTPELRRSVAANLRIAKELHETALTRHAAGTATPFTDTHGRYLSLVATINGTPRADRPDVPVPYEWLATAIGPHDQP